MIVFIVLVLVYMAAVINCAWKISVHLEKRAEKKLLSAKRKVKRMLDQRESLYQKKVGLEEEAKKVFTLYEMTKEITQSLNEEDAFVIFEKTLGEHILFQQCRFLDPLSNEVKGLRSDDQYLVFTLKGKRRKIGYLVVRGLSVEDKEKFMILAHQFALALRRVKLYQEIEKIAITDSLTEVHTRRYAMERLTEEMDRSRVRKIQMSLLMIDVDFFKSFNDEYGHITGDQILREIGAIIRNNIREIDIAGRYGGEEFCVVLPDTDRQGAHYAAERIRQAAESTMIKAYDATVQVTVSVGTATFPEDGVKLNEFIDKADWALYRAKKQGRNRVCSFGVYDE